MLELIMGKYSRLIAGTLEHGYYGEIKASEFITGDTLAALVGLTDGESHNSDAGWLKFSLNNKTLYVAKKPFRSNLSWFSLNVLGIVLGETEVTINGSRFKVRLLEGRRTGEKDFFADGFDVPATHQSEWNRLMYHVSGKPFEYATNVLTSEGISDGDWAKYTESELLTNSIYGPGSYCWCIGYKTTTTSPIMRGYFGVSYITSADINAVHSSYGWRPCLELIE